MAYPQSRREWVERSIARLRSAVWGLEDYLAYDDGDIKNHRLIDAYSEADAAVEHLKDALQCG